MISSKSWIKWYQWRKKGIGDFLKHQKVIRIDTLDELNEFYHTLCKYDGLVNVQEIIEGEETNLVIYGSYTDTSGNTDNFFTARKLLQYPSLYGTGVVLEGLPVNDIIEISNRLLKALNYYGISEG